MLQLALFTIVFCSGCAQWGFLLRVRQLLAERHPEIMRERASLSFDRVQRWAWGAPTRAMGDRELVRNIVLLRWTSALTVIAVLACGVGLFGALGTARPA